MTDQKRDINQAHHELERQRYRLQKELVGFQAIATQLKEVEIRAQQGDAVAIRQIRQLEAVANGELGQQMNALLVQLDDLQKKYERLSRLQKNIKRPGKSTDREPEENQGKLKKKRRNRIKYL